ncbi:hypothetical protein CEXT_144661 [Caerostris extrusa]|uniref:Uncharacterized protein n=1 Tax=Caerostris extrusa TaxID=172846 RepID=A0AAV4Y760_CAEEX|nr:hypothetical protein CEXT_144661 [Caerostris extrusa]
MTLHRDGIRSVTEVLYARWSLDHSLVAVLAPPVRPGSPVRPGGSGVASDGGDILHQQHPRVIQKPKHHASDLETNVIQTPRTLTRDLETNVIQTPRTLTSDLETNVIQTPRTLASDLETNVIQTPRTLTSDPDSNVHIQDITTLASNATTTRTNRRARTATNE